MFDLILKGGEVFDGTGAEGAITDVAIQDGRIAEIGTLKPEGAERVIDVTGLIVAPGFVDMHTHSDFTLIADGARGKPGPSGRDHRGDRPMRHQLRASLFAH